MEDRFRFNAIVTGYSSMDADTGIDIFLKDVNVYSRNSMIEVSKDDLRQAINEQHPELNQAKFNRIMQFFEDNSNYPTSSFYITLIPSKVFQSTGMKDKSGMLIFEGDKVNINGDICEVRHYRHGFSVYNTCTLQCLTLTTEVASKAKIVDKS